MADGRSAKPFPPRAGVTPLCVCVMVGLENIWGIPPDNTPPDTPPLPFPCQHTSQPHANAPVLMGVHSNHVHFRYSGHSCCRDFAGSDANHDLSECLAIPSATPSLSLVPSTHSFSFFLPHSPSLFLFFSLSLPRLSFPLPLFPPSLIIGLSVYVIGLCLFTV